MGAKETLLTKKVYSKDVSNEWNRLEKSPFNRLEFDTSMRFLKKYLPKKGLILDAGAGPGRYSIELAKNGYDMILLDLVPEHVEFAKKKVRQAKLQHKVKSIVEGTITNLSRFKTGSFDAVVCLGGPLSHVHPQKDRKKAVKELVRVAKKGAPIFVSVMGKFGTLSLFYRWRSQVRNSPSFKRFYFNGDDYSWVDKGYAHFFELKELESLFGPNTKLLERVGLEGLATPAPEQINRLEKNDPKAWKNWLAMHNALCTNPTVVEMSSHFMVIARKI